MSTSRVDVGTPPGNFKRWTTINVCFHGFVDLTTTRDEYVESPEFSCLGTKWRLYIYPGGRDNSDEGYAAITLCNCSDTNIKIQWGCNLRDANGKELVHHAPETFEFAALDSEEGYTDKVVELIQKKGKFPLLFAINQV